MARVPALFLDYRPRPSRLHGDLWSGNAAVDAAWPLDEGYEPRKTLYNLYHVLNHLNLFGAAYLGQAERMIRSLLSVLGG